MTNGDVKEWKGNDQWGCFFEIMKKVLKSKKFFS